MRAFGVAGVGLLCDGGISNQATTEMDVQYLPITYYWTAPLILDHLYLVGSKIADTKVSGF
jgi:hypothetical protein